MPLPSGELNIARIGSLYPGFLMFCLSISYQYSKPVYKAYMACLNIHYRLCMPIAMLILMNT
jgi:hypothetical protein